MDSSSPSLWCPVQHLKKEVSFISLLLNAHNVHVCRFQVVDYIDFFLYFQLALTWALQMWQRNVIGAPSVVNKHCRCKEAGSTNHIPETNQLTKHTEYGILLSSTWVGLAALEDSISSFRVYVKDVGLPWQQAPLRWRITVVDPYGISDYMYHLETSQQDLPGQWFTKWPLCHFFTIWPHTSDHITPANHFRVTLGNPQKMPYVTWLWHTTA